MSVRCPPALQPVKPMFSGSSPRFAASARTRRTVRWASCHAVTCFGSPFGRGTRYFIVTTVTPRPRK